MPENIQKPQKVDSAPKPYGHLFVHSIFYSIQGEGPFAGRPAIFIRLAGCNIKCSFCDTDYSHGVKYVSAKNIIGEASSLLPFCFKKKPLVVITGGEPFRQNISALVHGLLVRQFDVQIETNGTLPPSNDPEHYVSWGEDVTIICSPKTHQVNGYLEPWVDSYKYLVKAGDLYEPKGLPSGVAWPPFDCGCRVYLQPLDEGCPEKNALNTEVAVNACKAFGYTLCLQIHKIVGVE